MTELLAVIAILSLLTAIAVPQVLQARTRANMTAAEADIQALSTALEAYRQQFGRYPGDVFPSEDVNNDGVFTAAEDIGLNLDPDNPDDNVGGIDFGNGNGVLDQGDGVVNIRDLEWALRTSARGGPFIDNFPQDPWGQDYVYYAPYTRVALNDGTEGSGDAVALDETMASEDANGNGILDAGEDIGIADYTANYQDAAPATMRAGAFNGVLDFGDDINGDALITWQHDAAGTPNTVVVDPIELGNADISPDGYARLRGFYLYSVGFDGADNSHTGYEDINGDGQITVYTALPNTNNNIATEDINATANTNLDTGYEDTGVDGIPNTRDRGENDGELTDDGAGPGANDEDMEGGTAGELDIGGDDINSWNENKPWRQHENYN